MSVMILVTCVSHPVWQKYGPYASVEAAEENLRQNGWKKLPLSGWRVQHARYEALDASIIDEDTLAGIGETKNPTDLPCEYVRRVRPHEREEEPGFEFFAGHM